MKTRTLGATNLNYVDLKEWELTEIREGNKITLVPLNNAVTKEETINKYKKIVESRKNKGDK